MAPLYSVVIPSYNRMDVLPDVVAALEAQEGSPPFELVIVDDGSTDGTLQWLQQREFSVATRILSQENRGPAAARNAGVAAASGTWLAFLGDDTVPSAGWLKAHHDARRSRGSSSEIAVIGYTGWHERMRLTPFLHYINEFGLQFGYSIIEDPEDVPFNFFYTSNLSLERRSLVEEPFDLGFPYPAWEDIEVSYRLKQRGLRLVYESTARVAHHHPTDLDRFAERQFKAGVCAVVFYRRHPELGSFLGLGPQGPPPPPSPLVHGLRRWLARALQHLPVKLPHLWEEVLRYYYIQGIRKGWSEGVGERQVRPKESSHDAAPSEPG